MIVKGSPLGSETNWVEPKNLTRKIRSLNLEWESRLKPNVHAPSVGPFGLVQIDL